MAQKSPDDDNSEPSLELPSLNLPRLGRKKKNKEKLPDEHAEQPAAEADTERTAEIAPAEDARAPERTAEITPAVAEPAPTVAEPTPASEPAYDDTAVRHPVAVDAESDHGGGFALPALPGQVAALVTGVVVGALLTLLTYLALEGCEAVKGTSTCGGPGFFLLVGILIVMVLVGMVLLKAWQVADPGSTSFLAVGVIAVVALVVLIEVIFSVWMFVVVPIVGAGAYSLSVWVTTRFVEDESPGVGPDAASSALSRRSTDPGRRARRSARC